MSNHKDFIDKISAKLQDWDYETDRLEHRLNDLKEEAKDKMQETINALKDKKNEMIAQLEELESVTEEVAEDIKDGLDISWTGLDFGLTTAMADIKEYIHSKTTKEEDDT